MFAMFRRDPLKKLESEYRRLVLQARDLQRQGDIEGFAARTAQAEEVARRIETLRGSGA